ncbi:D-tyrosyl-tRNA(Tyr) deacylase [bacterium]|nr:D-tyrosyl-tRNA(Tyr) deacylase [bacterium]
MRALIQRVKSCSVLIDDEPYSSISKGMLILLGVNQDDTESELIYTAAKCSELRIFEDAEGKMNLSIQDVEGDMMVVSQFTLCANLAKGRRPGFGRAMAPDKAEKVYEDFVKIMKQKGINVATGVFGAKMLIKIENDGPVTFLVDTEEKR